MSHKNTCNKFKYIFLSERSPSEKAMYWMLPTMWQSGKCINMEIMKRLAQKLRREDQQAKQREFGGHWNYSVYHYIGGYMLLYICSNRRIYYTMNDPYWEIWTLDDNDG